MVAAAYPQMYFCTVLLLIDNYDSFTYNLYDYFVRAGAEVHVLRNDDIDLDKIEKKYDGIIFSPGPGEPRDAGCMMDVLHCYHRALPIFGVCLGMQAIGEYFGATLLRAEYPMHGKVSHLTYDASHPLFAAVETPLKVCRYHSLQLGGLVETPLRVIAKTALNEPMAIVHRSLPIWAVQFHPEAILTPQGRQLIENWLTCFSLRVH